MTVDLNALAAGALHRRAVEVAIWGMPLVSVDTMREAVHRDAGGTCNDILYFSRPADWKYQFTTPNASTYYVDFHFNTTDGPVVIELPAAVDAGLFGSIVDAWEVPVADVGPEGQDGGKGGKYLLLPPGHEGEPATGYFPLRMQTYNGYALFRAIANSRTAEDIAKAQALIRQLRVYPLSQAAAPPEQRYIDIAGKLIDGVVAFDDSFYDRLARMVKEEPVQTRDLVAMQMLTTLGITKDGAFAPDAATRDILRAAAEEAHEILKLATRTGERYWPDGHWILSIKAGAKTGFNFVLPDRLEYDERGMTFFLAFAAPQKLGAASFYIGNWRDSDGDLLDGGVTYRLRVPPKVPVKQYWAVTVYDADTACFIRDMPRPGLDSYDEAAVRNDDGSVDIYFGPTAPAGREANLVQTAPGREWFAFFRFYGPEKAVFDKSWSPGDIEKL